MSYSVTSRWYTVVVGVAGHLVGDTEDNFYVATVYSPTVKAAQLEARADALLSLGVIEYTKDGKSFVAKQFGGIEIKPEDAFIVYVGRGQRPDLKEV